MKNPQVFCETNNPQKGQFFHIQMQYLGHPDEKNYLLFI